MNQINDYFQNEYHYTEAELKKQFGDEYETFREDLDKNPNNYKKRIDDFMSDADWYNRRNTPLGWY